MPLRGAAPRPRPRWPSSMLRLWPLLTHSARLASLLFVVDSYHLMGTVRAVLQVPPSRPRFTLLERTPRYWPVGTSASRNVTQGPGTDTVSVLAKLGSARPSLPALQE